LAVWYYNDESWRRLPLEDGTQVMGLPPASKYAMSSEDVATALARQCQTPVLASRNIYLQFVSLLYGDDTLPCPLPAKPRTSKQGNEPNLPRACLPKKLRPRQTCSH
jgi:hypothetical protein